MQGSDSYGSALQHPRIREISSFTYTTPAPVTTPNYASGYDAGLTAWANASSDSFSSVSSSQTSVEDASDSSSVASNDSADTASTASSQTSVGSIRSQQALDSKLASAMSWQSQQQSQQNQQNQQTTQLPQQQRQHPRRTAAPAVIPSLVRQSERRTTFVDHLVDASTQVVQAIWPLSSVIGRGESGSTPSSSSYLLPLRTFIQETLRRSRASYSTLQVALYYLVLIKPHLAGHSFTMEQSSDSHACRALQCGRRMFLAALILASKYLQDRNYSARAWSKISGLSTSEINQNETAFLHAVNWRLHVTTETYNRWIECVNKFNLPQMTQVPSSPGPASFVDVVFERKCADFRFLIQKLSPSLDNVDELTAATAAANAAAATAYPLSPVSMCSSPEAIVGSPMTPPPVPSSASAASSVPSIPRRASQLLGSSRSSMGFAVAQSSTACTGQFLDRWPAPLTNMPSISSLSSMSSMSSMSSISPALTRRSSLANSVSTVSSPESMVSDSSLLSRTSTLSSVSSSAAAASWSMANAPNSSLQLPKLDMHVQARHQYGHATPVLKQQCSMSGLREQYNFGLAARQSSVEADNAAALALAELQQQTVQKPVPMPMPMQIPSMMPSAQYRPRPSLKRSRPTSGESTLLQDNVRDLLRSSLPPAMSKCSVVQAASGPVEPTLDMDPHTPRAACLTGSRKRLCRTVPSGPPVAPIATYSYNLNMDLQHPPLSGLSGPGMWQGVLN